MQRIRTLWRDERGQAVIEAALVQLVVLLGVLGGLLILSAAINDALSRLNMPAATSTPGRGNDKSSGFPVGWTNTVPWP